MSVDISLDTLSSISDVDISNVSDGQVLKYDSASSKWKNGTGGGGGASSLNDLSDVSISSASNGQVLSYDGTEWENTSLGTASTKDVAVSGDASSTEVVMGNDTRLTDSRTPTSHTHGNIQNDGTLQSSDVAIANGDKLIITDSSDSNKISRSSLAFDGSTTDTALTPKGTFESFAKLDSPAFTGTPTAPTASSGDSSTKIATTAYVQNEISLLPEPMVFRGSLGVGGTITALPVDGSATKGDTYKVITDGTYAGQVAEVGDTFICDSQTSSTNTWVLIPSGDEPSGTVTSVGVTAGDGISVSGSPITTSGTITVEHGLTSSQASVDNSGRTYIQDVTLDKFGHVVGLSSATETVTDTHRPIEVNDTQILGDNSTPLNLKAGTNVTLSNSGGDVTISAQGGGHTIQNDSGTALSQRPNLQFVGTYSEDDSTNSKTKVNIVRKMTKAQFDLLSADEKKGLIDTTDEPGNPAEYYTKSQTDNLLNAKTNETSSFTEAQTRTNIASGDTITTILGKIKKFFTDLKTVAFTGSYTDLDDKPTIPDAQIQSDWTQSDNTQKDFIKNKPTIPTKTSDLNNDSGFVTTDNKVTQTTSGTSSSSWYRVLIGGHADDTEYTEKVYKCSGLLYKPSEKQLASQGNVYIDRADGTSSTVGVSSLILGNNKSSGTAENSRGEIYLYSNNNRRVMLYATDDLGGNRAQYLPNAAGTLLIGSTQIYNYVTTANSETWGAALNRFRNAVLTETSAGKNEIIITNCDGYRNMIFHCNNMYKLDREHMWSCSFCKIDSGAATWLTYTIRMTSTAAYLVKAGYVITTAPINVPEFTDMTNDTVANGITISLG